MGMEWEGGMGGGGMLLCLATVEFLVFLMRNIIQWSDHIREVWMLQVPTPGVLFSNFNASCGCSSLFSPSKMGKGLRTTSNSSPTSAASSEFTELELSRGRSSIRILIFYCSSCRTSAVSEVRRATLGWKQLRESMLCKVWRRMMKPTRCKLTSAIFSSYLRGVLGLCWQQAWSGYVDSCSIGRQVRKQVLEGDRIAYLQVCKNASFLVTLSSRTSWLRPRAHASTSLIRRLSSLSQSKSSTAKDSRWRSVPQPGALSPTARLSSLRNPTMVTAVSLQACIQLYCSHSIGEDGYYWIDIMSGTFVEEIKGEEHSIQIDEEFSHYRLVKRYGNMKLLGRRKDGSARFMLGPHYPLFLTAYVVCVGLIVLLFYNYFGKFSNFWRVLLLCSCGSFLYSYLHVALSHPGIAHPRNIPSAFERQDCRFCHFCELVRERGTEHCEDCGVCIEEMDHHCPWVGKCIGRNNLGAFYVFLGCTFGNMIVCFIATSVAALPVRPPA